MSVRGYELPDWIKGSGPDADVVISTRARLARSLADFPFPSRASGEDLTMVVGDVRKASVGLMQRFPKLKLISVDKLSKEEKLFLLDSHVASLEQISGGEGRAVILEPSAIFSIMINEEDHLRLQTVMSGLVCEEAWELVDWADDVLAEKLAYGYSGKYGFLTASLTNVGTGLRVSAMMHLAGLALRRKLNVQLRAAYDLGVSIRGLFGEGTRWLGDMFQVSNEVTLGVSEREIVERVRAVARYLLAEEMLARKELLSEERSRLLGIAGRALSTLKSAMSVRPEEAIALMSPVRLAAALGLAENCTGALLNELLIGMQVGAGDDSGASIERASLLRKKLADAHIVVS
ncbi:MAG: ATP--guanido phosphotransferase [Armatimonadota bacterium]